MKCKLNSWLSAAAIGVSALSGSAVAAADYPQKPISMLWFWPAGGAGDLQARAAAEAFAEALDGETVVRNVVGGAGTVGTVQLLGSRPDGYTVGFLPEGLATIQPFRNNLPYTYESFDYVCKLTFMPIFLTAKKDAPFDTLGEMIAYSKEHEGLTYGVPGLGTVAHLTMENLQQETGIKLSTVPFEGDGDGSAAVRGGHIDLYATGASAVGPLSGDDAKILAVFGPKRLGQIPNIPTAVEQGFDFKAGIAFGIAAPKGIDEDALSKLGQACEAVSKSEKFAKTVTALSVSVDYADGPAFHDYLERVSGIYGNLIAKLGMGKK